MSVCIICRHGHTTVSYMLCIKEELDDRLVWGTGGHYHDEPAGHSLLKLPWWRNITQANLMLQPRREGGGIDMTLYGVNVHGYVEKENTATIKTWKR